MNTNPVDFFATPADLQPGFSAIEKQRRLKLVRLGEFFETTIVPVVDSLFSISDLTMQS